MSKRVVIIKGPYKGYTGFLMKKLGFGDYQILLDANGRVVVINRLDFIKEDAGSDDVDALKEISLTPELVYQEAEDRSKSSSSNARSQSFQSDASGSRQRDFGHFVEKISEQYSKINTELYKLVSEAFQILRLDDNQEKIHQYTNNIESIIKEFQSKGIKLTRVDHKKIIFAYIFIMLNSEGRQAPAPFNEIPRPNNDPSFILKILNKNKYLNNFKLEDAKAYITELLKQMQLEIKSQTIRKRISTPVIQKISALPFDLPLKKLRKRYLDKEAHAYVYQSLLKYLENVESSKEKRYIADALIKNMDLAIQMNTNDQKKLYMEYSRSTGLRREIIAALLNLKALYDNQVNYVILLKKEKLAQIKGY
jgi:hypothetical protein